MASFLLSKIVSGGCDGMQYGMSHQDRQWLTGELRAMEDRLSRRIEGNHETATTRLNDHSKRIRSLETHRGYIAGIGAALGFAASWLKDIIIGRDRKSTRLNSSHVAISYAVFCLKKKNNNQNTT